MIYVLYTLLLCDWTGDSYQCQHYAELEMFNSQDTETCHALLDVLSEVHEREDFRSVEILARCEFLPEWETAYTDEDLKARVYEPVPRMTLEPFSY